MNGKHQDQKLHRQQDDREYDHGCVDPYVPLERIEHPYVEARIKGSDGSVSVTAYRKGGDQQLPSSLPVGDCDRACQRNAHDLLPAV